MKFNASTMTVHHCFPQSEGGNNTPLAERGDRILLMQHGGELVATNNPMPEHPEAVVAKVRSVTYGSGYFEYQTDLGEVSIRRDILIHYIGNVE